MIIICDGHSTRFNSKRLLELEQNNVILFIGVPNATHIYQTLDDQIFLQYNNARKRLQRQWKRTHYVQKFKLHDEIETNLKALKEVMVTTKKYIESAAKNCGFIPFDPEKLKQISSLTFNVEDDINNSSSIQHKRVRKCKPNSLLPNGGVITCEKMRNYLDFGEWNDDETKTDEDAELNEDRNRIFNLLF